VIESLRVIEALGTFAEAGARPSAQADDDLLAVRLEDRQRFCTSEGIRPARLLEINIGAAAYKQCGDTGSIPPRTQMIML
jgi:hypothetical protein